MSPPKGFVKSVIKCHLSALSGVAMRGPGEFRVILFVRQDASGCLNLCFVQVYNMTGAAVLETMYEELTHLEPRFMAPLSLFCVCLS